jgi:uncharacterized surface protein with fasciclin (FAS1) repeats
LVAAATAAGLVDTLSAPGEFTVFAPTNDAFDALPEGALDGLLADTEALTGVLLYHAIGGVVLAEAVVELESATTLAGFDITIEVTDEGVVLNGSVNVTATDILCSNGVIHVIDAVLLPPQPTFCESWTATCGDWMMDTSCEDWWAAAAPGTEGDSTGATQSCYEYHLEVAQAQETEEDTMMHCMHAAGDAPCVAPEPVSIFDTAVAAGTFGTMLAAADAAGLTLALKGTLEGYSDPAGVHPITCEELVGVDVALTDGEPCPEGLTYEGCCDGNGQVAYCDFGSVYVDSCGESDTCAWSSGEYYWCLENTFLDLTVFAPTDDAFAKLPEGTVEALLDDVETLTGILLYHVLGSVVLADALIGNDSATTEQGKEIAVEVTDAGVMLNGTAMVTTADVVCTNGVIHIIDTVLEIPPAVCGDDTCEDTENATDCPVDCAVHTCCPNGSTNEAGDPGCAVDTGCEAIVCAEDSWCCSNNWDSVCESLAAELCDPFAECMTP